MTDEFLVYYIYLLRIGDLIIVPGILWVERLGDDALLLCLSEEAGDDDY